jgi:hypothetical protein
MTSGQLRGAFVDRDQHFFDIRATYMHCAVSRHFLPAGELESELHYPFSVDCHDNQSLQCKI